MQTSLHLIFAHWGTCSLHTWASHLYLLCVYRKLWLIQIFTSIKCWKLLVSAEGILCQAVQKSSQASLSITHPSPKIPFVIKPLSNLELTISDKLDLRFQNVPLSPSLLHGLRTQTKISHIYSGNSIISQHVWTPGILSTEHLLSALSCKF